MRDWVLTNVFGRAAGATFAVTLASAAAWPQTAAEGVAEPVANEPPLAELAPGALPNDAAVIDEVAPSATNAEGAVIYDTDFFDRFAPQSAADMVERIPGFTIRGGEGGERGFGQASLNILINGRRPSSKSLGANAILERISTERVLRIEILDGTTLDIPGLSGDVANIVTEAFGLTGNWEAAARFEEGTEPQWPEVEASATLTRGDVTVTGTVDFGLFTRTQDGDEAFLLPDGTLFEDRIEKLVQERQNPEIDFAVGWTPPSGSVFNLTGQVGRLNSNDDIRERFVAVTDQGTSGQSVLELGEDEWEVELGGDAEFGAGPESWDGRLKLIGLLRYEDSEFDQRLVFAPDGATPIRRVFEQDIEEQEIITRAEYTLDGGRWQVSGEYAYNQLEALNTLENQNLELRVDPLVRVAEDRVQGAVSHTRALGPWNVQANAGVEFSEISVPTAAGAPSDSFWRPKGFVTASRDLDKKHNLVFKIEREVGQLNFFDFVDEIDLEEGRGDAGNERIVPDQTWLFEATLERTDPTGISGRINPRVAIINDPVTLVRFEDGAVGPGNLDSNAYFYGVEANITWVLDKAVTEGLRLDGNLNVFETDIEDPLTGERRRFNGATLWNVNLQGRYDVPDTPYGFQVNASRVSSDIEAVRFTDRSQFRFTEWGLSARAEHKEFFGMNLQIVFQNLLDEGGERILTAFQPDRLGDVVRREERLRTSGRRVSLVLSDTF